MSNVIDVTLKWSAAGVERAVWLMELSQSGFFRFLASWSREEEAMCEFWPAFA